jgi:anti-sigma regulatory factor (Ser/Thr protein kinase)
MYPVTPGQAGPSGEPAALRLLSCRDAPEGTTAASVTFPGRAAFVPSARRFVRSILTGSPRADDLELIASEMMSNAIRHTPAGQPGGTFTLTVRTRAGWARVEVSTLGSGEWEHDSDSGCPDDEDGRGLAIIDALADGYGHDGNAAGQTAWAQVGWAEG